MFVFSPDQDEDLYYASPYNSSKISFGAQDLTGLGEVIIRIKKGSSLNDLQNVQTIRLVESSCNVSFCKQVDHYEAGYGKQGVDIVRANCVTGPPGASVENSTNGNYIITGSYSLGTFDSAKICLNWGGNTNYSKYECHNINQKGSGNFRIDVTKVSGGQGNMYLTMSSGDKFMFDTVLVNKGCPSTAHARQECQVLPEFQLDSSINLEGEVNEIRYCPTIYDSYGYK